MKKWINVTETFSEEQRHYKNTYLEICEVYDEAVEVSFFLSENNLHEIYVSYGMMYGIVYVTSEDAASKREEIKVELEREYQLHKEPTHQFIKEFTEKYKMCIPSDMFFDDSFLG